MPRDADLSHLQTLEAYLSFRPNTCFGLGEWRRYEDGIWPIIHEQAIKREIMAVAEQAAADGVAVQFTAHFISSVYNLLKARKFIPDDAFDANPDIVAFADCALHLPTRERIAHSPTNFLTSKLAFVYDPALTSTVWQQFLADTVPDCSDFLQEFAGYCLTTSTRHETALWLYGPPGGGKSTFVQGLDAMLGAKSCVLGLGEMTTSSFGLANLPGKTLAVSTEQPADFVSVTHIINALVSGERLTINRKYRDALDIVPHAKLVWAMNELPRINSHGEGLFRRVKVVHFPGIAAEVRDPRIKEAIMQSGMAITNWALEGLARLEARGKFEIPATVEEATDQYRIANDIPALFLDECCVRDPDEKVQASLLYAVYSKWCKATGHHPTTSTRFGMDMERLGLKSHKISVKYRLGVRLKVEGEDDAHEILDGYRDSTGDPTDSDLPN